MGGQQLRKAILGRRALGMTIDLTIHLPVDMTIHLAVHRRRGLIMRRLHPIPLPLERIGRQP